MMKLILVAFLFTSSSALYVDKVAHAPHHQPHHDQDCTSSSQTECWDVEKPQGEHKTERKCNTLYKKQCKPVQKTIYEDKCKNINDESCVTVYDTPPRQSAGTWR